MLYKNILFVGLTVYATLSRITLGSTYYALANEDIPCGIAGPTDQCIFNCEDFTDAIDCGFVGTCVVKCPISGNCKGVAIVNATNSLQLNVITEERKCFTDLTFHLPAFGNANFSALNATDSAFQGASIVAGSNTKNVYIECEGGKDCCDSMEIHTETAELLYIKIDGDNYLQMSQIYCPRNSSYDGTYEAPCSIQYDNTTGDSLQLNSLTISTLYGMPYDFWIDVHDETLWHLMGVTLTCEGIDDTFEVRDSDLFDQRKNDCWNTRAPTRAPTTNSTEPTRAPTHALTPDPTSAPIHSTIAPTKQTAFTLAPTLLPSVNPSKFPSKHPSQSPSKYPSMSPLQSIGSVHSSKESLETTQSHTNVMDTVKNDNEGIYISIIVGVLVVVCLFVALVTFLLRKRKNEPQQLTKYQAKNNQPQSIPKHKKQNVELQNNIKQNQVIEEAETSKSSCSSDMYNNQEGEVAVTSMGNREDGETNSAHIVCKDNDIQSVNKTSGAPDSSVINVALVMKGSAVKTKGE